MNKRIENEQLIIEKNNTEKINLDLNILIKDFKRNELILMDKMRQIAGIYTYIIFVCIYVCMYTCLYVYVYKYG
jgi:hypothetical protein